MRRDFIYHKRMWR